MPADSLISHLAISRPSEIARLSVLNNNQIRQPFRRMSRPSPPESLPADANTDQRSRSWTWDQGNAYSPYVPQPSMVAPGGATMHHDSVNGSAFQHNCTPPQHYNASSTVQSGYENLQQAPQRNAYGDLQFAQSTYDQHNQYQMPTPPVYQQAAVYYPTSDVMGHQYHFQSQFQTPQQHHAMPHSLPTFNMPPSSVNAMPQHDRHNCCWCKWQS